MENLQSRINAYFAELIRKSSEFPDIQVERMTPTNVRFAYQGRWAVLWLNYGESCPDLTINVAVLSNGRTEREIALTLDTKANLVLNEVYTRISA